MFNMAQLFCRISPAFYLHRNSGNKSQSSPSIPVTMSCITRVNCLKCSVLVCFLLFFQVSRSQSWAALDQLVTERQGKLGKNAVVLVLKGDSIVYKKELGDFNSKTVAPIASCGKWLTAALVMQFVEEGKISLDDKVANYLPVFEKYNKNYITIRHCLSHYTGIKNETVVGKVIGARRYKTLEEEVDAFAAREIRVNAGEDFSYGGIGLNIAARVLEVVSKKKFEQLAKQKLFTPLGMRKTSFAESDMMRATNPSEGAVSNADDYMHFLQMLLNKGIYQGKRILSEASIKQLRTIHSKPQDMKFVPKGAEGFDYALGAWVVEKNGTLGTALACPGLFGSWPMVDWCHGYAYLVITKSLLGEEKAELHLDIKKIIDGIYPSTCK